MKQVKMTSGALRWWPTLEEIREADDENTGFCAACGAEGQAAEPDAAGYTCEGCGEPKVYGAAECALRGWVI